MPKHDDHHSLAWPLIIITVVYGLPLVGCAVVAWLAWRVVRRG